MVHVAYCKSQKVNRCHYGTIREACDFVLKLIYQNCSNTHLQIILHVIKFLFKKKSYKTVFFEVVFKLRNWLYCLHEDILGL